MTNRLTAASFLADLAQLKSDVELDKYQRYFQFNKEDQSPVDYFIGVKMGDVFKLAKAYVAMPTLEIEKVLESPIHEARVGAVSIMDWRNLLISGNVKLRLSAQFFLLNKVRSKIHLKLPKIC